MEIMQKRLHKWTLRALMLCLGAFSAIGAQSALAATMEGIEFSSHLSPVGIRPVFRHAGQIDLLLGEDDLLTPEVKQQLRERFAYLAYLLSDSSFMAHKYNAGHPNFDADRYVAIAAIAMLYPDHPHSQRWLDHAVRSLREAMRIYVIPGSGKWAVTNKNRDI